LLVFNDTKVIPAPTVWYQTKRRQSRDSIERIVDDHHAIAHVKASKSSKPGTLINLDEAITV